MLIYLFIINMNYEQGGCYISNVGINIELVSNIVIIVVKN
jgi:hypothetical protein